MNFVFHPAAELEFNKAVVYSAIQRAVSLPTAWVVIDGDIRRSLVKRFPYGVLYSQEDDGIYIVAVMNLNRRPNYWKHRK